MPKTKLGKWAGGLIAACFLSFLTVILFIRLGQRPGNTTNLYLAIPGICAEISGTAAFFTGAVSMIKSRERSILVILATIIGFIVTLIVIMEVVEALTYSH
jgi:ABC-type transport system involved in multi-copper enzyme maturation permease subunit